MARKVDQPFAKPLAYFLLALGISLALLYLEFKVSSNLSGPAAAFVNGGTTTLCLIIFYLSLKVSIEYHSKNLRVANALVMSILFSWILFIIAGFIISLFAGPAWDNAYKQISF